MSRHPTVTMARRIFTGIYEKKKNRLAEVVLILFILLKLNLCCNKKVDNLLKKFL